MAHSRSAVELAAAKEHTVTARRTRVHVVMCHSIDTKTRPLMDIFSLADRVSPEVCAAVARELVEDILHDIALLRSELDMYEEFAHRQIARLTTPPPE